MTEADAQALERRRRGFLVGAAVGAALAGGPAPAGRRRAAIALSDSLLEELLSGGVDLQRLAGKWVTWWRDDGLDADPALEAALSHLADFDAPAEVLPTRGPSAIAAALPAALTAASPQNMVSGAFHTARMLDPDPASGLATVAVVLAAARFLEGGRDFVAEVLGLLRSNDAPRELYDGFAAIARDPRASAVIRRGPSPTAVETALWALRIAEHRPRSAEALQSELTGREISPTAGAILGALLGARDGIDDWPKEWITAAGEDATLRLALAERIGEG